MRALILLILFASPGIALADMVKVNAIALDGQTLRIGDRTMRLQGVEAPALAQNCLNNFREYPCGREARDALQVLSDAGKLSCTITGESQDGEELARCHVGPHDLGGLLVESGWALENPGETGGALAPYQESAKQKRRGLWQGQFAKPSEWKEGNQFFTHSAGTPY